jgi:hypothetical protein
MISHHALLLPANQTDKCNHLTAFSSPPSGNNLQNYDLKNKGNKNHNGCETRLIHSMNHELILLIIVHLRKTPLIIPVFFLHVFLLPAVLMKYLRIFALKRDYDQRTNCHLNIAVTDIKVFIL